MTRGRIPDWRYGTTAPTGAFRFEGVPLGAWEISAGSVRRYDRCGTIETDAEGVVLRMPRRE